MLHEKNLSPHRAIWALPVILADFGCLALLMLFGDAAPCRTPRSSPASGVLVELRYASHDTMAKMPNSLLTITLASNLGTFLLYMLSCVTWHLLLPGHPNSASSSNMLIPIFGIVREPDLHGSLHRAAVHGVWHQDGTVPGVRDAAVWASMGIYFLRSSKVAGRSTLVTSRT